MPVSEPARRARVVALLLLVIASLCVVAPAASTLGAASGGLRITGIAACAPGQGPRGAAHAPTPPIVAPRRMGPAAAAATIQVTYSGFSVQAQAAFQRAVDIWAAELSSSQVIRISASWTPLGDGILGSAGPSGLYRLSDGYYYRPPWRRPAAVRDRRDGRAVGALQQQLRRLVPGHGRSAVVEPVRLRDRGAA